MLDVNNPKVKRVIDNINRAVKRNKRREVNENFLKENRIFSCLCNNTDTFNYGPNQCADDMNNKYGYAMEADEILRIFRQHHIAHPKERKEILVWAQNLSQLYIEAVSGNQSSYTKFELMRKKIPGYHLFQDGERILAIMIYQKAPELNVYGDADILMGLGRTLARYFLFDMADAVAYAYRFPAYKERVQNGENKDISSGARERDSRISGQGKGNKLTYEEAVARMQQMERSLERSNMLLQELQDEFDEQISASKAQELAEFFSRLNSDKYGFILDELLAVRKGMNELKKRNYELPLEINGLLIMVRKLIQFVQDSHINPIMKVNSLQQVKAADVEFCNYEGTPFSSEDEVKSVRVISPGWIYKDKELQISRPKLTELTEE